jgi:S1-C subfamily serine protease
VLVTILAGHATGSAMASDAMIEPTDSASIGRQFAEKLGALLDEGLPVGLGHVQDQLPDEKTCPVSVLSSSGRTIDLRTLYATCRESVVVVGRIYKCGKCDNWHASIATGFVIGREGVVVTNHHVLAGETKGEAIAVRTWDGRVLPIREVLAASKKNDLAVIRVDADDLMPLPLAPSAPVGTDVVVIGHPVHHLYMMTSGIVSGHVARRRRAKTAPRHEMTITADFAKGSSGSPVLDRTGAVVGIVCSTTPVYYETKEGVGTKIQMVLKYCIPSSSLLKLVGQSPAS